MKLIDILVRELPKRGGWPEGMSQAAQDFNGEICFYSAGKIKLNDHGVWVIPTASESRVCDSGDRFTSAISSDWRDYPIYIAEYESALASHASQIASMGTVGDAVAEAVNELELKAAKKNPYLSEIKPGVWVDVYDVLNAWAVTNPALQHLLKKALQPGGRGHKSREQDLQDIIDSAIRAKELEAL